MSLMRCHPCSYRCPAIPHTKGQATPKHLLEWQHWAKKSQNQENHNTYCTFILYNICNPPNTCREVRWFKRQNPPESALVFLTALASNTLPKAPEVIHWARVSDLCFSTDCSQIQCVSHAWRQRITNRGKKYLKCIQFHNLITIKLFSSLLAMTKF